MEMILPPGEEVKDHRNETGKTRPELEDFLKEQPSIPGLSSSHNDSSYIFYTAHLLFSF